MREIARSLSTRRRERRVGKKKEEKRERDVGDDLY
jgi:hypothetical protein